VSNHSLNEPSAEEIEIVEEDLVDAYVRGELSLQEQKLLEKGLRSSPHLVERLHFARLLAAAANAAPEGELSSSPLDSLPAPRKAWWQIGLAGALRPPAFQTAFAACALVIFIGTVGLFASWMRLRQETRQLAEERASIEQQKLKMQQSAAEQKTAADRVSAELQEAQKTIEANQKLIADLQARNQKTATPISGTIATLFLLPTTRSGGQKELKPLATDSKVKLQLSVESIDYSHYQVIITNSLNQVVSRNHLSSPRAGKLVTVTVPLRLLPPGEYGVELSGISASGPVSVSEFAFRITERSAK
jgi:hypothetical protein